MKKRSKRSGRATRALDSLEGRLHLASDLDPALQNRIRDAANVIFQSIDSIHDKLFNSALSRTLPMVGDALKVIDTPADKFRNVAQDIQSRINQLLGDTEVTSADVQQELFNAVGPLLKHIPVPSLIPKTLTGSPATEAEFMLPLHGTLVELSERPDFFLGLPGFDLDLLPSGLTKVNVALTYDIIIKIGFSVTDGIYLNLDTKDLGEAQLNLNVTTPDFALSGNLTFLKITATNTDKAPNPNDPRTLPTQFNAKFALDFTDGPDANSRLTANEIGLIGMVPKMIGDMRFNIKANVDFGSGKFPRLGAYINLGWVFGNPGRPDDIVSYIECSSAVPANTFGEVPSLEFNDITLEAGTFFSNLVKPVFDEVNKVFKPVKPFVDSLYKRIDWLTDVHDDIIASFHDIDHDDSGDISMRDLIQELNPFVPVRFLDTFKTFLDIFGSYNIPNTGGYKIPIGSFRLLDNTMTGGEMPDLRRIANTLNVNLTTFDPEDPEETLRDFATANGFGDIVKFLDDIGAKDFLPDPAAKGLQFPLLKDPRIAMKLFLGQDVELFTFDMPEIKTPEDKPKIRAAVQVPILDIIHIGIRGSLGKDIFLKAKAKFAFGYDTRGLVRTLATGDPLKLFEGFYVSDRENPDGSGEDVNEIELKLGIEGFAGVGIPGFSIDIGAGPYANVTMNLKDFDNDGKVRPSELLQAFGQGPLCFMEVHGEIKFILRVTLTNPLKDIYYKIASQTLFSFNNFDCGTGPDEPVLAEMTGTTAGQLRLNTGTHAPARLRMNTQDGNEQFVVNYIGTAEDGSDTVSVQAFGLEQFYTGVRSLYIEGGAGNDEIYIDGAFTKPVILFGDFDPIAHPAQAGVIGNDVIYSGGGASTLYGGGGNDELVARTAGALMFGQDGDDTMHGSPGNDCILGGAGNDIVYGNGGNDTVFGESGMDTLYGMEGDDTMDGGTEDDQLYGFDGNDTLTGATGNDRLFGERGDDRLFGGSGNDIAFGNEGNDCLAGDDGIDSLVGGSENDTVVGGTENDLMFGDDADVNLTGGFTLFGGAGDDSMSGGDHDDRIHAQDGNDTVSGGSGNDTMIGAGGADSMAGDQGVDNIAGDGGGDTITGGDGNDIISGNLGADSISGDTGADSITGNEDNDTVSGGAENDTITGDDGADSLSGDGGADLITGNAGADSIFGNEGNDTLSGDGEDDTIAGGTENDTITGNDGADSLAGDQGDDSIAGGNAGDTITGGTDNDSITGDAGADSIAGDAGSDTIFGNSENDTISGGTENDSISGDAGMDVITAGAGDDFVSGGTESDEIRAGSGDDTVSGDAGSDRIWGGTENDLITGGTEADILRGEAGDDTVSGGDAADLIEGAAGNDCLSGDAGADRIYAGTGNDIVHGHSATNVGDDGAADTAQGEAGNDSMTGGAGADLLDAGFGVDTVSGEGGNDTLLAGSGVRDQLLGGEGDDLITGSDDGSDVDPLFLNSGDIIDAGAGNDTVNALGGADSILLGDGDDSVNTGQGSDCVRGGAGDDYLYAGRGTGDALFGDAGRDTVYGSDEGADTASGGDDDDRIYGQGGNDNLSGDGGRDFIDAGIGRDTASGGANNDEVLGGGGNLDNLSGDDGDDLIRGSNDGADIISGGTGRDRIFANAGNDTVTAGDGGDTVEGGAGDDSISGDGGADLVVGGANHDILYGHSASGAGDDNAVDSLYGDFGDGGAQPNQGRDQVHGGGGNDLLFGEGDDDLINAGAGTSNIVNFGSGEGANPADFVPPGATPPPSLGSGTAITQAQPTLPTGPNYPGRWTQFGSSATGPGVSNSRALAVESSIAVDAAGNQYMAWADARNGNYEIYVARRTAGGGWSQLAGSASEGGISNTATPSRRPSIAIGADGQPMVAYTEILTTIQHNIRVKRFDPTGNGGAGAWLDVGTPLAAFADHPILLNTAAGPAVVYLTDPAPFSRIHARVFSGGTWNGLGGAAFAAGDGISGPGALSVETFSATTNGTKVAVAWNLDSGSADIQLREFDGASWTAVETVAATPGHSTQPTVAYLAGDRFVAWQDDSSGHPEVHAARSNVIAVWVTVGVVSNTLGEAGQPRLASANNQLHLLWLDDRQANRTGQSASFYARKWNGSAFVAETLGDVTAQGLTAVLNPAALSFTTDAQGQPFIGWTEHAVGAPEVYLRANTHSITGTIFTADATTSVQSILDNNDLAPGDAIVISGAVPGFSLAAQDSGVIIIGLPGSSITSAVNINSANDVVLQRVSAAAINVNISARFTLRESSAGAVNITGSPDTVIANSTLTGLLTVAANAASIEHNTLAGGILLNAASNLLIRGNKIAGATGIHISTSSTGEITANDIAATATGLILGAPFIGTIHHNDIHNAATGVQYSTGVDLFANTIHHNGTGITSNVNGAFSALGFFNPASAPNHIHSNTTGVQLNGSRIQNQRIDSNTVGVTGSGILGPDSLALANLIERNTTGVSAFAGPIQFNRVARNATGIAASSSQLIHHNLIYKNTSAGLRVENKSDVRVVQNTFHTLQGDNVRVEGASSNVQLLNNIMLAEGGFNIFVTDGARTGFFSDYNTLHTTGTGKILHWLKDFNDIVDIQADLALFDLHSVGTTAVNPMWAAPAFANTTLDDYTILTHSAAQRHTSPTLDAGAPFIDLALPAGYTNLLTNPSFESNLTGWTTNPGATAQTGAAFDGAKFFFAGNVAAGIVEQTVNLAATYSPAQLDSEDFALIFGGRVRTTDDTGFVTLTFLNASSAVISTVTLPITNTTDRWELAGDRRQIPAGTRAVKLRFEGTRIGGASNDTIVDAAFVYVLAENIAPDQGAYGNAPTDIDTAQPRTNVRSPDLYADWELDRPHSIRWDTYGNAADAQVRIDLYQDTANGPALLTPIVTATQDDGFFEWIPQNTAGLTAGMLGLRIHISSVTDNILFDRGQEYFAIPESGNAYYVDDSSNTNDQFTPSGFGNNRNTGKTAATPKPLLTTVLRTYDLGPADDVFIDTGNYQHFAGTVISGATGIGDDEGVTISGPSAASNVARIDPLGMSGGAIFDINDGDFVTLERLSIGGLTSAVQLRNNSINFRGSHLTTSGNAQDAISIDAGSVGSTWDHLDISGSGRHGINAASNVASVTDSRFASNAASALFLSNSGPIVIEANDIFGGARGISIGNGATASAVIGNTNLALGRGNKIHHNSEYGIDAGSGVLVAGNTINNNSVAGVNMLANGTVTLNVIFDNYDGIRGGSPSYNRLFHNANIGITSYNGSGPAIGNVIYSNNYGVIANLAANASSLDGPYLFNNLIYANSLRGVHVVGGRNAQIFSNTIYQPAGDAIRIDPNAGNGAIQIKNNILAVGTDYAINVNLASQAAVTSDYNDFVLFGGGKAGFWSGAARNTLSQWRSASLQDANALAADPMFNDIDGADNTLGWSFTSDGRDDDFHLKSTAGSFKNGALAPAVDSVTGLPVMLSGAYSNDAATSPLIDRGDPALSFANEPAPNGGFVNIGTYANTAQASKSVVPYVTVTVPIGGEIRPAGQLLPIKWRSQDFTGTADVELWRTGGVAPVLVIADDTANDGLFDWVVPSGLTSASDYFIRVSRAGASGDSPLFSIAPPSSFYYVNDATFLPGDLTTAEGNDNNSGTDINSPKATIADVLNDYDLGPGDVIIVDAGTYLLVNNIIITNNDSGVTISGAQAPARPVINRNNTATGAYVFQLNDADNVTITGLKITGAERGIFASNTSDSDNLTISANDITANAWYGIFIDATNNNAAITNNDVHDNAGPFFTYGIAFYGSGAVSGNRVYRNTRYGIDVGSNVNNNVITVSGNEVYQNSDRGINAGYGAFSSDGVIPAGVFVTGNNVHDNSSINIAMVASYPNTVIASDNDVYGGVTGITVAGRAEARQNIVHGHQTGIAADNGVVADNRVYGNAVRGILANTVAVVSGNRVYSNGGGLEATTGQSGPFYRNNLIYNNADFGIQMRALSGAVVENNTVYQPTGDAFRLLGTSFNVRTANNIFAAGAGYAMRVESASLNNYVSDYNDIYTFGAGKFGRLDNREFLTRADWLYELGLDAHSITADPRFVDIDGADDLLGAGVRGLSASIFNNTAFSGAPSVTRIDPKVELNLGFSAPDPSVAADNFSIRWTGYVYAPTAGIYSFFSQADDGERLVVAGNTLFNNFTFNGGGEETATLALAAGWHPITYEMVETVGTAQAFLRWSGPGITKQIIQPTNLSPTLPSGAPGDFGPDDDFHLRSDSPAIDSGDPDSYAVSEPLPNGARINHGNYGNTREAATSPLQFVQVTLPNGLERVDAGTQLNIQWRSGGLTQNTYLALVNLNGPKIGEWKPTAFGLVTPFASSITNPINTSGIPNPAPASVYQTFQYADSGIGKKLSYLIPVSDGSYTLRLHLAEPFNIGANARRFDIKINGVTVQTSYDVFAAAGGHLKAVTLSFPVIASAAAGIAVELVNTTNNPAFLNGIEISAANPSGVANPTADLEYSIDGGANWLPIASDQPIDIFGKGSFNWTVPNAPSENVLVRVRADDGSQPSDVSDAVFTINPTTNHYYVNDGSTTGDVFTTAVGNNANSGKSADKPMASLSALLAAYDLSSGDVVHVDAGTYNLINTIFLNADDSGVVIEGPQGATALFTRGGAASPVFLLNGADNLTLDRLSITGGNYGIQSVFTPTNRSDNIILSNLDIFGHSLYGISLYSFDATGISVLDSRIHDNAQGLEVNYAVNFAAIGNTVYNNGSRGITVSTFGGTFSGNIVFGNHAGMETGSRHFNDPAARVTVSGNTVYNNNNGINIGSNVVAENNIVHGHVATGSFGINSAGGVILNNTVFGNYNGIAGIALIQGNSVFNNSNVGINVGEASQILRNTVYNNRVGIFMTNTAFARNNLVYNNTDLGMGLRNGRGSEISGNTIYQPTGDGVAIDGAASEMIIKSNIFQLNSGIAITVTADSGTGMISDYNNFHLTGTARIGKWHNREYATRADWYLEHFVDAHSISADPQFLDPNGADNALGGSTMGLTVSYFNNTNLAGAPVLVRRELQINNNPAHLPPGPGVNADNFSARIEGYVYIPADGTWTFFGTVDDGQRLFIDSVQVINQPVYNNFVEVSGTQTLTAGWHQLRYEWIETTGNSSAFLRFAGPGVGKQIIPSVNLSVTPAPAALGTDDDFRLAPNSPSIDKGEPAAAFLGEPSPNGGRVNQGHDGNSANATTSSSQAIHLIGPNGYDKLEAGHVYPIEWRSSGLRQTQTVALINAGGPTVGDWTPSEFHVGVVNITTGSITDTSLVTNAPPLDVYRTVTHSNPGIGNTLAYQLPVQDGQYALRFHFQESFVSAGQRKFDVRINGVVVRADFDVIATAGGFYKAVALSFSATATGGAGLFVEFVNKTVNPAFVCGIEVAAVNAANPANPTADIQLSTDNGANWTTIAANQPMDSLGRGVFNWTPAASASSALIRVVSSANNAIADQSDAAFLIANGGNHYYVNDASTAGDTLTTVAGSNYNSGKSPDAPMASLHSLLLHYDLDAGDIIHVDNGTYALVRNILMTTDDSGVHIQGPSAGAAAFNRQISSDGYFIFEFAGADDVTLDRLKLTNAWMGVRLYFDANSDRVTVTNSEISQIIYRGIFVGPTNDDVTLSNNSIHDIAGFAPWAIEIINSPRAFIAGNTIFNAVNGGIIVTGSAVQSVISGNTVFGSGTGIQSNSAIISDNLVRNNVNGISVDTANGIALRNVAHSNQIGILTAINAGGVIDSNRVYNNSVIGIAARGPGIVRGNSVYSNPIGILGEAFGTTFTGQILSNFVYANTNFGIQLTSANGAQILNNTVYQNVGDAVRIAGSANITLRNNILWTDAGAAVFVNSDSQTGFNSDYNLLHKGAGGAASIGSWAGVARTNLASWQAATGQDAHSVSANPEFVDLDGADNILGYVSAGGGVNGGLDDNPYLSKTSPAIDRGDSWKLAHFDRDGANRFDESSTPNLGTNDYAQTSAANQFSATGTARNFRSQNNALLLNLPFAFPFYDAGYNSVYVGTNGVLEFGGGATIVYDPANSIDKLITRRAVAPLWDNLRTNAVAANDIFIDTAVAGQVKIRWNAAHVDTGQPVNVAVVLFSDGRIRFDYGGGNTGLSPTIGISYGNGQAWQLTPANGAAVLTNAGSVEWSQAAGFVDLGAYEFRGQTTDNAPPTITGSTPASVFGGSAGPTTNKIDLIFSEPLNSIDAHAPGNYQVISAGPNGAFGDSDDIPIAFTPVYVVDSNKVTLQLNGHLAAGQYRLTAYGSAGPALRDLSGNKMSGDFVRTFKVGAPVVITPANNINTSTAPMTIKYQFTADVGGSLSKEDLILTSGAGIISPSQMSFVYDANTFTATWTLNSILPDGNYRASILASSVTDGAGQALSSGVSQTFFALNCDFNRDGVVNHLDFNILYANFGANGTHDSGDANFDGKVNFADFQKVETAMGRSAAALPPAPGAPISASGGEVLAASKPGSAKSSTWNNFNKVAAGKVQPARPVMKKRPVATHADISRLVSPNGELVGKAKIPAKVFNQKLLK